MLTKTPRHASSKDHPPARGIMLWRRIADDFEQMIRVGKYDNGARLPPETDLAAQYNVNRHTVRRAMGELAARGLVRTERGSGTYAKTDKLDYRIGERTRFSEIVAAAGHEAQGRLHGSQIEPADAEIAGRLGLAVGSDVVRLEIIRMADRVPLAVSTNWLDAARFPDAAKIFRRTRSITRMLAHYGVTAYRRHWTRIGAGFADAADARHLRLSVHRPILIVEAVNVSSDRRPVLTTRARFAADRVALIVEN